MKKNLHVLVLDDSAMVRQVLSTLLSQEPDITVTTAATGPIAFTKMKRTEPDVIILDLEMAEMDGLTFLKKLMETNPIPVVICSDQASRGSDKAIKALELGAIEIVNKPQIGVQEFLFESAVMITDTVRAASQARVKTGAAKHTSAPPSKHNQASNKYTPTPSILNQAPNRIQSINSNPRFVRSTPEKPAFRRTTMPPTPSRHVLAVAIGASTGGTEALADLLCAMPQDAPGIAIVQHMPAGFTAAFASRLNDMCNIEVIEGKNGDLLCSGRAIIAPGDKHMLIHSGQNGVFIETTNGPLVSRHRPSCDVLFQSVARSVGRNAIGVILTGMGADGADGMLALKKTGARTIAQNEASCVVYGMPKVAVEKGAIDEIMPLHHIAGAILRHAGYKNQ